MPLPRAGPRLPRLTGAGGGRPARERTAALIFPPIRGMLSMQRLARRGEISMAMNAFQRTGSGSTMELEQLRDQTCASLALLLQQPEEDVSRLVDECLADARKTFRNEFIAQLSPAAWARITLIYFKHFLDTGCDVSVAEIVATVVRDSINTSRMDMLTLQLAQQKIDLQAPAKKPPSLTVVKD